VGSPEVIPRDDRPGELIRTVLFENRRSRALTRLMGASVAAYPMAVQFSVYLRPLAPASIVSVSLGAVVDRNRDARTAPQLPVILLATVIRAGADAVRLRRDRTDPQTPVADVRFLGSTLLVLAVVLHALAYSGRSEYLTSRNIGGLAAILVGTDLLVWADWAAVAAPLDGLIYAGFQEATVRSAEIIDVEYGPWFYRNALYFSVLLVAGMGMYVPEFLRRSGTYRRQTFGSIVALVVP